MKRHSARLDGRERACLVALVNGDTDERAARRLGLSRRTFRRRVKDAMDKLGARSRFEAGYLFAHVNEPTVPVEAGAGTRKSEVVQATDR